MHAFDRLHRHGGRYERRELFDLTARDVDLLTEVAVAVEETDRDERNTEVSGGFEMIAGEHTEAPRILWHRRRQAVLGRKVRDAGVAYVVGSVALCVGSREPAGGAAPLLELIGQCVGAAHETLILGEFVETSL